MIYNEKVYCIGWMLFLVSDFQDSDDMLQINFAIMSDV
jgi:hypothetical protein